MEVKILQIHKRSSYEYRFIQDKYSFSNDGMTLALADGTTQSFKSESWAELICNKYILDPVVDPTRLLANLETYAQEFRNIRFDYNAQPAKASLERSKEKLGSTSTFLGLLSTKDRVLSYISIGDSNIFLITKNQTVTIPFPSIDALDSNNSFLNTESILLGDVNESNFITGEISVEDETTVIVATDALSRLFLQSPQTQSEFLEIANFEGLRSFCMKYWDFKLLQEDDITAFVIGAKQATSIVEITPPADFKFPKEIEFAFSPPMETTNTNYLALMKEFQIVIDKQKELMRVNQYQKNLMFILIAFSILSLLIACYVGFEQNTIQSEEKIRSETQIQKIDNLTKQVVSLKAGIDSSRREVNKPVKNTTLEVVNSK
jgi:hypothetical protein